MRPETNKPTDQDQEVTPVKKTRPRPFGGFPKKTPKIIGRDRANEPVIVTDKGETE